MTEQPVPPRPNGRPVRDPTGDPTPWVDLPTAATMLGVSGEAIRQRIKRGTLRAEKREGRWYVAIDPPPRQGPTQQATQGRPVVDPTEPLDVPYRVDGSTVAATLVPLETMLGQLQGFAERIEALASANGRLGAELAHVTAERDALAAELDALRASQAAQDRPGGPGTAAQASEGLDVDSEAFTTTATPWWAFWRRQR